MTTLNHTDLRELQNRLTAEDAPMEDLQLVSERLHGLSDAAGESSEPLLARGASVLSQLVRLAIVARTDGDAPDDLYGDVMGFARYHVGSLADALEGELNNPAANETISAFTDEAENRWREYLVFLDDNEQNSGQPDDGWFGSAAPDSQAFDEESDTPESDQSAGDVGEQIEMMLSALQQDNEPGGEDEQKADSATPPSNGGGQGMATPSIGRSIFEDDEMREAFLDDAARCLGSMEKCSLAVEACTTDRDAIQQFCRELHTLKGASASAGLGELADFIHQIESSLNQAADQPDDQTAESMLEAVDRVRDVIAEISSNETPSPPEDEAAATLTHRVAKPERPAVVLGSHAGADESLIRIRASKLDRLMDMLAELVVLRNRRESHIAEFSEFNEELFRCVSRLNFCHENLHTRDGTDASEVASVDFINGSNTLQEIAKDITVVSNGIRELQKPVGQDNHAISQFIRDFRQELMQLRRVPIAGLFSRLQRAARDAAKKEGKTVQLVCIGEESGLEQELQEKLYEPLLHIIRNAVSHGIEDPETRKRQGKNPTGRLTLEAQSNSQLLAIQVSDDGGGLDYDAIRRRSIEKGLARPDTLLSDEELSRMIFHPGFSTREQATEVSGRGVGMDIVAAAVEQMRGRIEIQSRPDEGTTMRLILPLRSAIEHVMVIRSSGQLFGIPMQAVSAAKRSRRQRDQDTTMPLSAMLSLPTSVNRADGELLMLRAEARVGDRQSQDGKPPTEQEKLGLEVDEIVGPEEVVVRSLPGPLAGHPLFCGLTLSGAGETVLLLDSRKLVDYFTQFNSACQRSVEVEDMPHRQTRRVLVVDDSLSARKMLVKRLSQLGFGCTEAGDGIEALEILRREKFDLVVTDLDMPRLGGLEMLFDMQQHGRTSTPVIVVSARTEDEFRHQAMDYGAYGYLTKPVDLQLLQRLLDELEMKQNDNLPENGEQENE